MKKGGGALDWGGLVALIVHPTKVLIVEAMDWIDRPLSSSELVFVFGEKMSVSAISYHVNSLARYGCSEEGNTKSAAHGRRSMSSQTPSGRRQEMDNQLQ